MLGSMGPKYGRVCHRCTQLAVQRFCQGIRSQLEQGGGTSAGPRGAQRAQCGLCLAAQQLLLGQGCFQVLFTPLCCLRDQGYGYDESKVAEEGYILARRRSRSEPSVEGKLLLNQPLSLLCAG